MPGIVVAVVGVLLPLLGELALELLAHLGLDVLALHLHLLAELLHLLAELFAHLLELFVS